MRINARAAPPGPPLAGRRRPHRPVRLFFVAVSVFLSSTRRYPLGETAVALAPSRSRPVGECTARVGGWVGTTYWKTFLVSRAHETVFGNRNNARYAEPNTSTRLIVVVYSRSGLMARRGGERDREKQPAPCTVFRVPAVRPCVMGTLRVCCTRNHPGRR